MRLNHITFRIESNANITKLSPVTQTYTQSVKISLLIKVDGAPVSHKTGTELFQKFGCCRF